MRLVFHRNPSRLLRLSRLFLFLLFAASACAPTPLLLPRAYAAGARSLEPRYRHWLEAEVPYIISSDERKQFLRLASNAERDHFIENFWEIRNPTPGAEPNVYKEEHYARLAYANEHFGNIEAQNGWRTDQGRIYITLGAPKQKETYPNPHNVRPIEIWFYQTTTQALPPYFYILFFQRSYGDPMTIYSPFSDGPAHLVTTLEAMNDQKRSLDTIRKSLGDEVARTTISLIPGEPVDFDDYKPSLTSDMMLGTITGLADNPLTKQKLERSRLIHENVTSTLFTGTNSADLETATFRDSGGRMTLNYLMRCHNPDSSFIGTLPSGKTGYSVTLKMSVLTPQGAEVYEDVQKLTAEVTDSQVGIARTKRFGVEGRLPLAPGKYQLVATLTNDLTRAGLRQHTEVTIPAPDATSWGMSSLLAFSPDPPKHISNLTLPFTIAGIRFAPRGAQTVAIHQGENLRVAFQLWDKPGTAGDAPYKVNVHYAYGAVSSDGHPPMEDVEDVDGSSFDAAGNMLTGHSLTTTGLVPGNYRLVITAVNSATQQRAFASIAFVILPESEPTDLWTVYNADAVDNRTNATDDYKRGLSAIAQGDHAGGAQWLERSLADDSTYTNPLKALVDLYSTTGQEPEIARLSHQYPPTQDLDESTAIRMAQGAAKTGDLKQAKQILEFELQFQAPSAGLYQALAQTYEMAGETAKAEEYRKRVAQY